MLSNTTAAWQLRPYQRDALNAIATAWQSRPRTLAVMATGTGKTTVFAEVAKRRRDNNRGRCLVVAHRTELISQAKERLELAGLTCEVESGEHRAAPHGFYPSDVVVATIQTLKGKRLEQWAPNAFGTIIVDEAHHATAASYRAVLDRFTEAKTLGVTATPDRGDGVALGGVIDHLAYEYQMREAIRDGFLCPLRMVAINTPSIDMTTVRVTKQEHGHDLNASDLAAQMTAEKPLHEMAGPIVREAGARQTIIFVPSVAVAHELARVLAAYTSSTRVASLDGTSGADIRADTLLRYKSGDVQFLVNCALFTEGFDAPNTACVAIARPTKSRALYAQMVGRGTRLASGKADCLVLDLAPDNARHALVSPIDLLVGKPIPEDLMQQAKDAEARGEDIEKALSAAEKAAEQREQERGRERSRARAIADVKYQRSQRDPFAMLGKDKPEASGELTTVTTAEKLARFGVDAAPSAENQAKALYRELSARRSGGLCTFKQARTLVKYGLNTDMSFDDAGKAIDALAGNNWRMTADIAERFSR